MQGSLRAERAAHVPVGPGSEERAAATAERDLLTPMQRMHAQYRNRRARQGDREESTLSRLERFRSKLQATQKKPNPSAAGSSKETDQGYAGEVLETGEDEVEVNDESWMAEPIRFKRHIDDDARAAVQELVTYDPLDPASKKRLPDHLQKKIEREDQRASGSAGRKGRGNRERQHRRS